MDSPSLLQNIPTQREARWQLLKEIIADWYPPVCDRDGFDNATIAQAEHELGFGLPVALKEWYGLAGRRADIWSRQDELLVVIVVRIVELIIWTLVLLQGTFTPLIHAHAGRTQSGWSGLLEDLVMLQRLFTAAQPERCAALILCEESTARLSVSS